MSDIFNWVPVVGVQGPSPINNMPLYGGGSFGAQTDAYSAAGAAYGRATGGFNGGAQVTQPNSDFIGGAYPAGNVERGADLPDLSQPTSYGGNPTGGYPQLGDSGSWWPSSGGSGSRDDIAAQMMLRQMDEYNRTGSWGLGGGGGGYSDPMGNMSGGGFGDYQPAAPTPNAYPQLGDSGSWWPQAGQPSQMGDGQFDNRFGASYRSTPAQPASGDYPQASEAGGGGGGGEYRIEGGQPAGRFSPDYATIEDYFQASGLSGNPAGMDAMRNMFRVGTGPSTPVGPIFPTHSNGLAASPQPQPVPQPNIGQLPTGGWGGGGTIPQDMPLMPTYPQMYPDAPGGEKGWAVDPYAAFNANNGGGGGG